MSRANALILAVALLAGGLGFVASRIMSGAPAASVTQPGDPLPPFQLKSLEGEAVASVDLLGQPVLLNFWATWCAPCREEMPALERTQQALNGRALVVGIAMDEPAAASNFVAEIGVSYPQLTGSMAELYALSETLGNEHSVLPFSVFVAADGTVSQIHYGVLSERDATSMLRTSD